MLREIQTQIQEDYTRVEVYFQTLNVKSIIQSALYPVITFTVAAPLQAAAKIQKLNFCCQITTKKDIKDYF